MATVGELQDYARQMASQYGVPGDLFVWQIGQESSWNPTAKNPNSTAYGIAQFTNPTAQWWGVNQSDPYSSLEGAASYMRYLYDKTGSWIKALRNYGTTHGNPTKEAQAMEILGQSNNGDVYAGSQNTPAANAKCGTFDLGCWYDILAPRLTAIVLGLILVGGAFLLWRNSR